MNSFSNQNPAETMNTAQKQTPDNTQAGQGGPAQASQKTLDTAQAQTSQMEQSLQGPRVRETLAWPVGIRQLTFFLLRRRFSSGEGSAILFASAIISAAVTSALTLTVAGGTFMFWNRWKHPQGLLAELLAEDFSFSTLLQVYVFLALFACILLAPAAARLTANATVLGAKGRESRLSALRLLGLSGADVTRVALIEATIQAVCGVVIGMGIYLATLPLWQHVEMQAMPIGPEEMLLPWWLILILGIVLVVISVVAAAIGMRRIQVTPLGVARQERRMRLGKWRPITAAIGIAAAIVLGVLSSHISRQLFYYYAYGVLILVIVCISIVLPWLFEHLSGAAAHLPGSASMVAARRVQADAKAVWHRVGAMALLAFIAGFSCYMPISFNTDGTPSFALFGERSQWDMQNGVLLTLIFGFILAATSTMISQAADVFDRANEVRALQKMGVRPSFATRVSWLETLVPLVISLLITVLAGIAVGYPNYVAVAQYDALNPPNTSMLAVSIGAGLLLTVIALLSTMPLRRRVLRTVKRRND